MMRNAVSPAPPAAEVTTRTGLLGKDCASAAEDGASRMATPHVEKQTASAPMYRTGFVMTPPQMNRRAVPAIKRAGSILGLDPGLLDERAEPLGFGAHENLSLLQAHRKRGQTLFLQR